MNKFIRKSLATVSKRALPSLPLGISLLLVVTLFLGERALLIAESSSESSASASSVLPVLESAGSRASSAVSAASGCYDAAQFLEEGVKKSDGSTGEQGAYEKALQLCPSLAEASFNLGVLKAKQGKLEDATAAIRRALEIKDDESFRLGLAAVLRDRGEFDESDREYARVLAREPGSVKAYQGMALTKEKRGDLRGAIEAFEKARDLDERSYLNWFNLGVLYGRASQYDAAASAFARAAEIDPKSYEVQIYLGQALRRSGAWEKGQRAFERAAELRPQEASVHVALGSIYDLQGDPARAELSLRRAVDAEPTNSVAWISLALIQLELSRAQDAERSARRAVQIDPQSARSNGLLAWALLELGRLDEAKGAVERSANIAPESAAALFTSAVLKARSGESEQAERLRQDASRALGAPLPDDAHGWRVWRLEGGASSSSLKGNAP